MARCPNCGRETARTSDWGCQYCGYPLMSGNYKKLDKTYQEIREERMPPPPVMEEEPEPEPELEPEPEPELEPEPEPEPEIEPEPEPAPEPKPRAKRKTPAKPKAAKETKAAAKPKSTTRKRVAKKAEPEPESELEPGPEPEIESEPESKIEDSPEPAVAAESGEVDMVFTVSELISEYEADGQEAEVKLSNKILKLTGVIERIEVKALLNINYIILTTDAGNLMQGVRCNFGMQYSSEVSQLITGQAVTVQGKYDGSIINMSLRDCILVN
ncbi:hypothetical protein ACFLYN_05875 [Chloroflexota bacterium]